MLSALTGSLRSLSTYSAAALPVAIRRENSVNANNRNRFSAQSNCFCVVVDRNRGVDRGPPCIQR